ncbi:alpha/beta hydrolase [Acidisphaera sp. L21]|uniref:alpha/beta hydrolase n=1 Tax=Acidisphaera sp. L21 TaxID=1641851 RepID=UPI001C207790|nr:alpha/beta hydrolase [Acidisphaera sp. L21]
MTMTDGLAMHPDAMRLMEMIRAANRPPYSEMTPEAARQAYAAGRALLQLPWQDVAECRKLSIPGPGGPIPVRLYRGAGTDGDRLPALVYFHGGGWVFGDLDSHEGICRRLANYGGCRVVSVQYRLAPEHPFPAAIDDAAAALRYVVANAADLGVDPARLAVGGDSAGGNLAAVTALMARDGTAPALAAQLLLYPVTDLAMETESYKRFTQDVPLTSASMRWFIDQYVPAMHSRGDWRAAPARAATLAGTPPAIVLTVGMDPLCDEGQAYAKRLVADGVRVASMHLSDQVHGMLTMNGVIAAGDGALQWAAFCLRDAWRPAS